jgi:hypothetical protein
MRGNASQDLAFNLPGVDWTLVLSPLARSSSSRRHWSTGGGHRDPDENIKFPHHAVMPMNVLTTDHSSGGRLPGLFWTYATAPTFDTKSSSAALFFELKFGVVGECRIPMSK